MPALKRRRDPMPKSRKKERIMVAQTTGAVLNLRKKEYTIANPIDSAMHATIRYFPLTTSPDWN